MLTSDDGKLSAIGNYSAHIPKLSQRLRHSLFIVSDHKSRSRDPRQESHVDCSSGITRRVVRTSDACGGSVEIPGAREFGQLTRATCATFALKRGIHQVQPCTGPPSPTSTLQRFKLGVGRRVLPPVVQIRDPSAGKLRAVGRNTPQGYLGEAPKVPLI